MKCKYLVVPVLLAMTPLVSQAARFTPPDLTGFTLDGERDADGDGDGIKESHIRQYHNAHGDSAFSLTTDGRLWAWSLETRDDKSGPKNYVIRDSDCDGIFDEVYGLDEKFHVPPCAMPAAPAPK